MIDYQTFTHDEETSNDSGNRPFQDLLNAQAPRRAVVGGGLPTAMSTLFATSAGAAEKMRGLDAAKTAPGCVNLDCDVDRQSRPLL